MAENTLYKAALMEHNAHPDYKYEMENPTHTHEGINPSCGDEMTLFLRVDKGVIAEASFVGHGCAVSLASADMMADIITGETVEEAMRLTGLFLDMIKGKELTAQDLDDLDDAAELASISRMPARVKCAELSWRTLEQILADDTSSAACTEQ